MDIDVFTPAEQPTVLRVLRTALNPNAPLGPAERRFLEAYARIANAPLPEHDVPCISPFFVNIPGRHQRKRLLQLAALAALLARPVRVSSIAFLDGLSFRLGLHDPAIDVAAALSQGRPQRARLLTLRRLFRSMIKEAYAAEGIAGVTRLFAALLLKARVNGDKLWNYKRLGLLPEGTLGREYWKHQTSEGFGFPGEPGGIPDSVAYHDVVHVLAGHDTTPRGEIQQASFQAGNRREDGFFFIQFAILQFHHGIRVTPVARAERGYFDPEKVLWAVHRGAKCTVDMTHRWNYWPLMALPIDEARARCGVLPRSVASA